MRVPDHTDHAVAGARPRVLMLDQGAYAEMAEHIRAQLDTRFDTTLLWTQENPDIYLDQHGAEFSAILNRAGLTRPILEKLPNLQLIAHISAGLGSVPLDYVRERHLLLSNGRGVLSADVADVAIALMLCASRDLTAAERLARSGAWVTTKPKLGRKANGKTYAILGLGSIGTAIARRLDGFDGSILYHNRRPVAGSPYAYFPDLQTMAAAADFLFVAAPGDASTLNLVNEPVLRALGPDGIVINVGRGTTIDEAALIRTLADGGLGGAGLDVHADEPRINPALLDFPSVTLLPHVGSSTVETRIAMHQNAIDNIVAHFAGEPLLTPV